MNLPSFQYTDAFEARSAVVLGGGSTDARIPATEQQPPKKTKRIAGIDMARGIAMAGMVVVHFVAWREGEGAPFTAAELLNGRAMPLFMLLGGIGVTFMTRRSATPTRNLLIRAAMLMVMGLVLTEYVDRLAIVLQAYALFFALAVVLWRLPSKVLLAMVPIVVAIGSFTYQTVGRPAALTPFDTLFTGQGIESLIFDGFYPLFPVGAFFIFGIWLGRLDLGSDRIASILLSVGVTLGIGIRVVSDWFVSTFGLQVDFGGRAGDGNFHLTRLLDAEGHSSMPAWTLSALGTSAAVLGLSLLIARRFPKMVRPLVVVGSMSLTFYVFQAWVTNLVPSTRETGVFLEWGFAIGVYVVFTLFALVWVMKFRTGPLERVLRLGSGPKKPLPA